MFWKNWMLGLKAMIVSILANLLLIVGYGIAFWLTSRTPVVAGLIYLAMVFLSFAVWGWIATGLFKKNFKK